MSQPFEVITDPDVEERRKARAVEYGTWECGPQPIEFNGARAFNEGEPVPKSTVERLSLDKLGAVVATGTYEKKQAETAQARQKAIDDALQAAVAAQSPGEAAPDTKTTKAAKGGNS